MHQRSIPAGRWRFVAALALFASLMAPVGPIPPATAALPGEVPGCSRGSALSSARFNLDRPAASWGVFPEQGGPICTIANVSTPSLDGISLKLGLAGGAGQYPNAHFYRHFNASAARTLVMSTWFRYEPTSTCNNQSSPSVVQAIEFAVNKWQGGRRWEGALQWSNVADSSGGGSQWRYWDPSFLTENPWRSFPSPVPACLAGDAWHFLQFAVTLVGDSVRYDWFAVDNKGYSLGITVPSTPPDPTQPDRMAMAVQLDGNQPATPYSVFIDQAHFVRF